MDRRALRRGLGVRDVLDTVLVRPELVAEISADQAVDHDGVFRHPLRFKRLRLEPRHGGERARFEVGPATVTV
ncbi:hypothetical protein [Streptomyces sp. NPDC058297]|uniref:hypothetical protein n=1 Tax=Streptomyces sp. NPDC058297 TaxID=3346433 RepID=UPI0036F18268